MKVKIIKDHINRYGRKKTKGEILILFKDDAIWSIDKGYAISLDGNYEVKKVKTKNKKEDK